MNETSKLHFLKRLHRVAILLLMVGITAGCRPDKQQLLEDGYQVFDNYSLALKLPCALQLDETLVKDTTIGDYVVLVCPQIFKDSSRTSFYIERLIASGNTVYHVNILTNSPPTPVEILMERQKQILELFHVNEVEETQIDGKRALIYNMESKRVTSAHIPDEFFSYDITVNSDTLRREKLDAIIKTVKFGPFRPR